MVVVGAAGEHPYVTEHAVSEVSQDAAHYQVGPWMLEVHDLNPVLRLGAGIQTPIDSAVRIGDQRRNRLIGRAGEYVGVDVFGRRAIVIDEDVVEAADDEVDGPAAVDRDHVGS